MNEDSMKGKKRKFSYKKTTTTTKSLQSIASEDNEIKKSSIRADGPKLKQKENKYKSCSMQNTR